MDIIQAIILAVIQGITEWLPISSSAHLSIANYLFNIEGNTVFYAIMLHFMTALTVLFIFRKEFVEMLKAFFKFDFKSEPGKKVLFLIIATIPAALAGVFVKPFFEIIFSSLIIVGGLLVLNGIFLFFIERNLKNKKLTFKNTFIIGLAQIIAILPGVSRSGTTIGAGLLQGIKKEEATKFAFFLGVPLLIGAGMYELLFEPVVFDIALLPFTIGMIVTALTTYFAINFLLKIIRKNKLWYFGIYCIALGLITFLTGIFL